VVRSIQPSGTSKESAPSGKYVMTISRLTIDKLGVKLYDKVSAVLAELVANSYDADATLVTVRAPMGEFLASKAGKVTNDKGYVIEVEDDGIGMTPDQVNEFYLRVGAERRIDPKRGGVSRIYKRKVMGRKGVGKLAPFGICQKIEVITSGGELVAGKDVAGQPATGYLTAHLVMDRKRILSDVDENYHPTVGQLDGIVRPSTGTLLRLTNFSYRQVPDIAQLERQMSQRFGTRALNWAVMLIDNIKTEDDPNSSRQVGEFEVATMSGTKITFDVERSGDGSVKPPMTYRAFDSKGDIITGLEAGFSYEGDFYLVTGWIAYSKEPYKDDLMAGVRIYCNDKIAAQTSIFNRKAGFTGEHDIRSYLVGELHADWLDADEDLIQTDRRDILWSHELGQAFQKWGQSLVLRMGNISRDPMKKKTWDIFKERSNIEKRVREAFPSEEQKELRERAMTFAKVFGQTMREDEIHNDERIEEVVQLTLLLAPHVAVDEQLRKAGDDAVSPIAYVNELLDTARIAALASYGRIADQRIRIIKRLEDLKDDPTTPEEDLQKLIQEAPWLIDAQWTPLTANKTFTTLRKEFEKYYKKKTGEDINLGDFTYPTKRADFVLATQENILQIIEIKRPDHAFADEEMLRLDRYITSMEGFLNDPAHKDFKDRFGKFHVTLICDELALTGLAQSAFRGHLEAGRLTHVDWTTFFVNATLRHQEYLDEVERQQRDTARRTQ
jgi:hypothetical protein